MHLLPFLPSRRSPGAETCTLELKRFDSSSSANSEEAYHAANAQSIFVQIDKDGEPLADQEPLAAFKRIVKKEPKYRSEHPFRAVLKLGSKEYAFALDAVPPPAKEAKPDEKKRRRKSPRPTSRPPARLRSIASTSI